MTDDQLQNLNDACDRVDQALEILLGDGMSSTPFIQDLREAINDAHNKLHRVISGQSPK